MAQQIPLPLTVFCFSKIQIGFTFLVPAHPGSPRQRAVKTCVFVCAYFTFGTTSVFIMLFRLYTVNRLKWIALEPDYEYPLIYLSMFFLYIVSKWDQTDDIHLSRLSTSAVYTLTDCWGLSAGYQPRPQVVDRGTTARYGGQLRYI